MKSYVEDQQVRVVLVLGAVVVWVAYDICEEEGRGPAGGGVALDYVCNGA